MRLSSPEIRADRRERVVAIWLLILAMILAGALRLPELSTRPMHTDESTQAIKFRHLKEGSYRYDPVEHHGPTLLFSTFPSAWLNGRENFGTLTESDLRIVPVFYGLLLVMLIPMLRHAMGWMAVAWAALFLACSPINVFYSRYYIMEVLLMFFSFTAIMAGWRFYRSRHPFWLWMCAISFGLMHATKETFIIHLIGMVGAVVFVWALQKFTGTFRLLPKNRPEALGKSQWIVFLGLAAFTSAFCFSLGFKHLEGITDSIATYQNYVGGRTTDHGHVKPWHYYLQLLTFNQGGNFWKGDSNTGSFIWSEALVMILAVIGIVRAFIAAETSLWNRGMMMFLSVYAILTFGAYSFVGYKTPWCILSTYLALILLAGFGAAGLIQSLFLTKTKWFFGSLIMVGVAHLGLQSYRSNFKDRKENHSFLRSRDFHSRAQNPYAYGFTPSPLINDIVRKVESYASSHPAAKNIRIEIVSPHGAWPLPWYFRNFRNVAYLPDVDPVGGVRGLDASADIILIESRLATRLPDSLRDRAQFDQEIQGMINQQVTMLGFTRRTQGPLPQIPTPPATPPAAPPAAPSDVPTDSVDSSAPALPAMPILDEKLEP